MKGKNNSIKYYIEIGTCNFDTLTHKFKNDPNWLGLCVEPLDYYLNDLPHRDNTIYENSAVILDENISEVDFYTIQDKELLAKHDWVKGSSSLNPNHNNLSRHYSKISVKAITFPKLIEKYNFYYKCDIVKIDAEGLDGDLVDAIYNFYTSSQDLVKLLPKKILFEAKHCLSKVHYLLSKLGDLYDFTENKSSVKVNQEFLIKEYDICFTLKNKT